MISTVRSQINEVITILRNFSINYAAQAWGVTLPVANAILVGVGGYILIVFVGVWLHKRILKNLLKKREKYTRVADELLFLVQSQNKKSPERIREIIKSRSYESKKSYELLLKECQEDFPSQSKQLKKRHTSAKITAAFSALYGRTLTIVTLGIYKLFW